MFAQNLMCDFEHMQQIHRLISRKLRMNREIVSNCQILVQFLRESNPINSNRLLADELSIPKFEIHCLQFQLALRFLHILEFFRFHVQTKILESIFHSQEPLFH